MKGNTRVCRAFGLAMVVVALASAQNLEDGLRAKLTATRYAPLAEQARIQGDVHLKVLAGVITVLSGHPMLVYTAAESAKIFASIPHQSELDLLYHFIIVDALTVHATMTVQRGNSLERAVLRVFGRKTEKVVVENRCQEEVLPANELKVDGAFIEIWVYGRERCLQTLSSTLIAGR